jgi:tetratricopeptide (TPR) repeat protein
MTQDAAYYAKRSSERFESGDIEGGDADLNRAIELDPDNVEYRWERGRFRYNAEEYALMVEDISKIVEVSSDLDDLQEAYILLSIAYDALGQDQELIAALDWRINHGGDASCYDWRANLRLKAGDSEGAIDDLTKALEMAPGNTTFQLQRARAYYFAKRYEAAIADLTQIFDSDESAPRFLAIVYSWRGRAYYHLGEYDKALADFNKDMVLSHATVVFSDATAYMRTFVPEEFSH